MGNSTYQQLVNSYEQALKEWGFSTLKLAQVCLKAKDTLKKNEFSGWLKEAKVNLKRIQANKLVEIARACQNDSRLSLYLKKEGVEKTYALTTLKDQKLREQAAEVIIDAEFTVSQVKKVVKKVEKDQFSLSDAIAEVKAESQEKKRKARKVKVQSDEDLSKVKLDYFDLKQKYDQLLEDHTTLQEENRRLKSEISLVNDFEEVDETLCSSLQVNDVDEIEEEADASPI